MLNSRGRPKPKILEKFLNRDNYVEEQVCTTKDILYVIVYNGKPFTYRRENKLIGGFRYKLYATLEEGTALRNLRELEDKFGEGLFSIKEVEF